MSTKRAGEAKARREGEEIVRAKRDKNCPHAEGGREGRLPPTSEQPKGERAAHPMSLKEKKDKRRQRCRYWFLCPIISDGRDIGEWKPALSRNNGRKCRIEHERAGEACESETRGRIIVRAQRDKNCPHAEGGREAR